MSGAGGVVAAAAGHRIQVSKVTIILTTTSANATADLPCRCSASVTYSYNVTCCIISAW